jgi:SAM-dependent methyltransferase
VLLDRAVAGNEWDAQAYDTQFGFVGRYGDDVLDLLDPRPGERILDLGCGPGRHAAEMVARGAKVVGMDADKETEFDLNVLGVDEPFSACFSNAALHWMTPQDAVLRNVHSVLAPSGRFVAEMGGDGNIAALDASLREALVDVGLPHVPVVRNYSPTAGQQAAALETAGFRVELAAWFRRPTLLAPGTTAADWTRHFRASTWSAIPDDLQRDFSRAIDTHASARGLLHGDEWTADYCRLRFIAIAA